MKTRRLLTFVLCFVMLVASFAVIASASGAEATTPFTEVTNADGSVTTKYGTIPSSYANATTYPFVLFKYKNGALNGASVGYKTMKDALNNARGYQDDNTWDRENKVYTGDIYTSKIILRRDYTTTTSDKFDNYAQTMNETVLDLNGYTLTQGAGTEALFYRVTSKPWGNPETGNRGVFETEITVINGDIEINDNPVFSGNVWNCLYYDAKGNSVTAIYNSSKVKLDGAKIMQDENGKYYYIDTKNNNAVIEKIYDANGVEIDVNGIHLSSVISMADKDIIWNFDNVKFKYASGATETSMMMNYAAPQGTALTPTTAAAPFYFNFNNCTFDLSTNAPSGNITLFNAAPSATQWLKTTVTVSGCEIVAPLNRTSKLLIYKLESVFGSSVTLVNDANGNALTWTLPEGTEPYVPTSSTHMTLDGKKLYWHKTEGNTYAFTECVTGEHTCVCGAIFTDCVDENADNVCDLCDATKIGGTWFANESEEQYPFAVLDANGAYSSLQTTWKNAVTAAVKIDGSTIVMRRDYKNTSSDSSTNLKAVNTEFTVDLNGHVYTRGYSGAYIFDNWWDAGTTAGTAKVNFKNGTLVAEKWLINLSGNDKIANEKQVDFNFENVTFKFASDNDKTDGWVFVVHSQTYTKAITANIVFTDCTFDTTDMRSSLAISSTPALNLDVNNKSGVDYVKCNVTFNGGKIIANRFETKALCQTHADDTVTFNKGTDGNYITLEMADGKTPNVPTAADYFVIGESNLYFHKSGSVYTLTECLDPATNHECVCGAFYSDCSDADKNHICDVCGEVSYCIDENKDHACDLCDKNLTCAEIDNNNDHVCDTCAQKFDFIDANNDELCDHCGYVVNDYGIVGIPESYASTKTYPFFVLKLQNGVYTFEGAYSTFYGRQSGTSAMGYAIYNTLEDNNKYNMETGEYGTEGSATGVATAIVVMRRDYSILMGNKNSATGAEYHDNIAHAQGHLIVDLGGYTLSEAEGSIKSVFTATIKGWTGSLDGVYTSPSTYTFKNGNVKVLKYAFATVGTSDQIYTDTTGAWSVANAPFTLNFENVNFGFAEGATTTSLAFANGGATNKNDTIAKLNVNFTGCTFDVKTNAITTAVTLINNADNGKDVDCDVVINGCEIIASSMENVKVYQTSTRNGSGITFKKGENDKYITLTMPKGSVAPAVSNTVTIDTGVVCAFVKTSETAENVNYTLYPAVMVGYKIKTSVTLWSNFVYNIYIPVTNVSSFTVNGAIVDYEEVEIEGVLYYHVAVNLPAGETLESFALKVALVSGETTVDASWTLDVFKYTKAVLAGEYNDTTKTLMKDMLAYASAAHTYFENTESVSDKLAEIETLLGGYTTTLPTGEAKKPAGNTYFTDVAVYLGAVPSFRFYLADGYTVDSFTFTVGDRKVDATLGNDNDDKGDYLEVTMYAYMMLEDVSYTVVGTEVTESYNLFAYYAYANTLNNDNLTAIVEALMTYAASAKDYRDYVLASSCFHQYVNGTCTKCGKDDPNVGTMTLTAPSSIYSDYPGKDLTVTFSKDWYNKEVTFTTDNPNVFVENGKIFAKGNFANAVDVTVTATTAHHTASVIVNVSTYNSTIKVESKLEYYEANIIKEENKGGMIFVGDSYFDGVLNSSTGMPPFWNDFYTDWAGEKAFLMGMSSSQIHQLEIASERIVYPMEPSEIVVHIGHNDMHHGDLTPEQFVERLTALFNEYHRRLPNATIYYCSVDPKKAATPATHERHESSFVKAPAVNAAMKALAETTDWLVYVDTTYIFYGNGGTTVNTNMYPSGDGSHPTLYAYDLIRYTLNKARGIEVVGGQVMDADNHVTDITNEGMFFKDNNGNTITSATGDFVISGKLAITDMFLGNSHVQFRFVKGKRFLLHDSDGDGIFFAQGAAKTTEKYDANNGLVLEWAVVVKEAVAYLYINGNQEATFEVPSIEMFNIGVMDANVTVFDVKFSASSDADYATHVGKYTGERVYVEKFGNNQEIAKSGITYETDAAGNTLAGSNFVAKGKLQVYTTNFSNPHIQFSFGNGYRFLLWDSDSDGLFGIGYRNDADGALIKDTATGEIYQAAKGGNLSLEWAVVVEDGKAYFYINGVLKATMTDPTYDANDPTKASFKNLNLGALQMNMLFYDIEIYAENGNSENYNAAVAEYNR